MLLLLMQVSSNSFSIYAKVPNAQPGCVDDMTKLAYLHEPALLYILASRWELGKCAVKRLRWIEVNQDKKIRSSSWLS